MPEGAERRPFVDRTIEAASDAPLDRLLRENHPGASWGEVRRLVESGKVTLNGELVQDPARPVRRGTSVVISMRRARARDAVSLPDDCVVHQDAQLVVARKPAGLSSVPYGETETDSLATRLDAWLRRSKPAAPLGIVHRLDKATSGLLVFARTLSAKRALKQEFRFHRAERRYLAVVHGSLRDRTIATRLVKDRGDGRRGSTDNPKLGRDAITHVRVLEPLTGATLIECRLETGRTHQIRIHLGEIGHPVVGERVYQAELAGPPIDSPRLMLHATLLGFTHPTSGKTLRFEDPPPADFQNIVERLRRR